MMKTFFLAVAVAAILQRDSILAFSLSGSWLLLLLVVAVGLQTAPVPISSISHSGLSLSLKTTGTCLSCHIC